jgi:hypothetical protein
MGYGEKDSSEGYQQDVILTGSEDIRRSVILSGVSCHPSTLVILSEA